LRAAQAVLVDRHSKTSREETLEAIARRAQFAATGEGPQVALFPEGTTTNGTYLLNFKVGAFKPGLPVQPVHLNYYDPLFSWTVDNTLGRSLFKIWTNFKNSVEVVYMEPYVPNEEEKKDAQLYADNVRRKMADQLNLPITNHSVEDAFLLMAAQSLHVPNQAINVQYNELKKLYNLGVDEIKNILRVFASMDKDHSGTLDATEFAQALNLPFTQEVYDLFHLFDQDESGTIDFKEFVLGLSILNSKKELESDTVKYCFSVFDENNDGVISRDEFKKIMSKLFLNIKSDDIHTLFSKIDSDKDGFIRYDDWAKFAKEEPGYIFIASDILQKFKPEQAGPVASSISGAPEAEKAMSYTKLNKSV
jgi:lysophosphatidylcholine acyltransferase/lyso-PAF acetyltransferase